jgi:aminoglycoside phosphotransferase (APT) family kinase protein
MPGIDVADDSFVVAAPARVAARLRDPAFWRSCWGDLELTPYHDRGDEGVRWYVTGALVGTAELWLEPFGDGTLVHVFLRADPESPRRGIPARLARRYTLALKAALFRAKDDLEAGRVVGTGPASVEATGVSTPEVAARRAAGSGGPHAGAAGTPTAGTSTPPAADMQVRLERLAAHRRSDPAPDGLENLLRDLGRRSLTSFELVSVTRLRGGVSTATHRLDVRSRNDEVRALVLKRYAADDDTAALEWERLGVARHCAVPTPEPVMVDLDGRWFGTPALVMTALPGEVLFPEGDTTAWVRQLATALAAIHLTDFAGPLPEALRRPPRWETFEPAHVPPDRRTAVVEALSQLREQAPALSPVLCHSDFHAANVLFDSGLLSGVVDWSAARIEPPAWDVANCRVDLAVVAGGDAPDLFTTAYAAAGGSELAALPLFDVLAGARAYAWAPYVRQTWAELGRPLAPEEVQARIDRFVDDALARAGVGVPTG